MMAFRICSPTRRSDAVRMTSLRANGRGIVAVALALGGAISPGHAGDCATADRLIL
ncbi:MAG: hypothetical protein JO208_05480 [Alphaproteobacteria bacterium]|nr:hypothetical protein [Alphaproteobacteria bacterium]